MAVRANGRMPSTRPKFRKAFNADEVGIFQDIPRIGPVELTTTYFAQENRP